MGSSTRYLWVVLVAIVVTKVEAFVCSRPRTGAGDTVSKNCDLRRLGLTGLPAKKDLRSSERERRDEERRRLERANDVIIGKTSARDGAKNFELDPKATEEEWLRQASIAEQEVFRCTDRGMELLKMLRLEEANESFDAVFSLKPDAYLWQAGIAKFYLGDYAGAADTFARSASIYESKFGEPASEERIWRYACELKLLSSMSKAERENAIEIGGIVSELTPLPDNENTDELMKSEMRKVIRITRELFEASVLQDDLRVVLSRAKLRSIGGTFDEKPLLDRKMWKLNSWYYLGLHYDVLGSTEESKKCMKMALWLCPSSGNGSDIVHTLPMLHMSRRDWFDDDEVESQQSPGEDDSDRAKEALKGVDPVLVDSIRSSLGEMRHIDLKDALRSRGLRVVGSKDELLDRLFDSLMSDTGLMP